MRVQTVDATTNSRFHRLLQAFERRTGVPVLLNTSFNIKGEAIVCTTRDALRTFWTTGIDALALGNCLIEKPVATSEQEIAALTAAAGNSGTVVMPGHNYAHLPEFQRMVRLVRAGELGEVRALFVTYAMRHRDGYAARVGGAVEDLFVHPAYLAVALLGRPSRVMAGTAGAAPLGEEDQAWITVESGRASGHLLCTFAVDDHSSDPWTFAVRVLGSEGSSAMTWRDATLGHTDNPNHLGGFVLPMLTESFEHEAVAFRDAIATGVAPVSTVADAVTAWELLTAARESIATA